MMSPIEKSLRVIEYTKTNSCTSVQWAMWLLSVGLCKGASVCATSTADIVEMKLRITAAIETIDRNMLGRVWDELDYMLDICRVTNGATLSIFKECKTFRDCHSDGTSYSCIAVILTLVKQIKNVSIICRRDLSLSIRNFRLPLQWTLKC
jgi:hypothetical protein